MGREGPYIGQLGPYGLVQQIAVGGMAEIYLAKTRGVAGFEKYLCLKVIHPNFAGDEHFIEMLIDEAKIAVSLNHANIAQIFDLGCEGKTYFIAMEYIDGADLFQIMRRLSELDIDVPVDVAAYIAHEICSGLDYAHRKRDQRGRPLNIIHRDISPQNILLSYSGEVKIVDFGIAKAASRSRRTQAGVIKGKYYYMSPEQAWGDPVDQRSDIFSAGIILYEVLTGRMLYLEEDMHRLLDMVRKADIPRPTTLRPDVPPQLESVVMKALAKRPADRWQTAHEFRVMLTSFLFSYAPGFTPSRLADLVTLATATEPKGEPLPATEPPPADVKRTTRQVELDSLMSRVDYQPDSGHSVLFRLNDLKPDGGPVPLVGEEQEEEEDRGERTMISGPPAMMDDFRAGAALDPAEWETDDCPTQISLNAPPVVPDPSFTSTGTARARTRSRGLGVPVELIVPASTAGLSDLPHAPNDEEMTPPLEADADEGATWPLPSSSPAPQPAWRNWPNPPPLPADPINQRRATLPPASLPPAPSPAENTAWPANSPPPFPAAPGAASLPPLPPGASFGSQGAGGAPGNSPAPANAPWGGRPAAPFGGWPLAPAPPGAGLAARIAAAPAPGPAWPPMGPPASPSRSVAPTASLGERLAAESLGAQLGAGPAAGFAPTPALPDDAPWAGQRASRRRHRRIVLAGLLGLLVVALISAAVLIITMPLGEDEGTVEVISVPEGAEVTFDGQRVQKTTPVVISVAKFDRAYPLQVTMPNYQEWKRSLTLSRNDNRLRVLAVLTPIYGRLDLRSTPPGADIYINGEHRGKTPATIDNLLPTEDVRLELRLRGYRPQTRVLRWENQTYLSDEIVLQSYR